MDGLPQTSTFVPNCCPEGVYLIENPAETCGCTDNKLESPYRLSAVDWSWQGPTVYSYIISTTTTVPPPVNAEADCNDMGLDRLRIYVLPSVMGAVTGASFNNVSLGPSQIVYGNDTGAVWLELQGLEAILPPIGTLWTVDISVNFAAVGQVRTLCAPNALGTDGCEVVFYGKFNLAHLDFDCCAHGLSETPAIPLPPPNQCDCDASTRNSPFAIVLLDADYVAAPTDETTFGFGLVHRQDLCDAGAACCASDLKSVFIQMDATYVTNVTATLYDPAATALGSVPFTVGPTGLTITAGSVASGDYMMIFSVVTTGNRLWPDVCGSSDLAEALGCSYRVEGGYAFNDPYGCCPQGTTGPPN